ncbi:MAG: hypothetical protein M3252_00330 [Actinomycetota bacterium]|nr:hypothetical protein [Actinomycetota bacterium]
MIWLWWIGNLVFLFVIIPVVVLILHWLLRTVIVIGRYTDDILEHGVAAIGQLDAVEGLVETRESATRVSSDLQRYGAALSRIL